MKIVTMMLYFIEICPFEIMYWSQHYRNLKTKATLKLCYNTYVLYHIMS